VEYTAYIASIRENIDLLVDAAEEAGLAAPVPTCPGWTVDDLLVHVASELYARVVKTRSTDRPDVSWFTASPPPGDRYQRARDHGNDLADALAATPENTPVWTFAGPGTTMFWARRGAHEMLIHRCDAEIANSSLSPIDADLAADGIDEFFDLAQRRIARSMTGDGETLHFHCTDRDVEYLATLSPNGLVVRREHAKGDVAVRAPASALLLLLWNRLPYDSVDLEVYGDRALLERWPEISRI